MSAIQQELYTERNLGEVQVFGAPGCGKSTYLARQIHLAAARFGVSSIMVASFTKAGAVAIAGKDLPIKPEQVATLHAHAYRSLGSPTLIEADKDLIAEWNRRFPALALKHSTVNLDDPYSDAPEADTVKGDEALAAYNLMRAKMQTASPSVYANMFGRNWEEFKRETESIDFTDMIELAYKNILIAPGAPSVIFIDEAQDNSALEWALIRKWSANAEYLITGGDDDQELYNFKGASSDAFLHNIPEDKKIILGQSYRVPLAVQQYATRWIEKITKRQPKTYKPRLDEDGAPVIGQVRYLPANITQFGVRPLIEDVQRQTEQGKSVMILTSCSYMLQYIKKQLKQGGFVYHNPYRRKRGDWNPVGKGKGASVIRDYLAASQRNNGFTLDHDGMRKMGANGLWTGVELKNWVCALSVSNFLERGAKNAIEGLPDDVILTGMELDSYFNDTSKLFAAACGSLPFFMSCVSQTSRDKFDYLTNVAKLHSVEAFYKPCLITIGTIHSVKGGEADIVYLFPDLSARAWDARRTTEGRDAIIRQFYVGMTRAFQELVICGSVGDYKVTGL